MKSYMVWKLIFKEQVKENIRRCNRQILVVETQLWKLNYYSCYLWKTPQKTHRAFVSNVDFQAFKLWLKGYLVKRP